MHLHVCSMNMISDQVFQQELEAPCGVGLQAEASGTHVVLGLQHEHGFVCEMVVGALRGAFGNPSHWAWRKHGFWLSTEPNMPACTAV
jgi:hypothetical protein